MDEKRSKLKQEYKQTLRPMGIYQIQNQVNGKRFIAASPNLPGSFNSARFQLKQHCFLRNRELQQDWDRYGPENFTFEVIDELKPVDDPLHDYKEDLKALEELWLEKLQPYGERGYHKMLLQKK
ncbi:hypothetical protein EDC14_102527 [Hydrogenispora ethanolica]|uniref:GIY-YIG catalytic domain-containing protein n=1 Tax=Hydrogenispora ethanolica TaxID=1082276 RepID=A0A4R1R9P5_HYDET|nr:GIY-YIG nuclease family protein [Hydrogenispora ethanolica]TCL62408.1 hypothetical protein EDC14_102527 [Hydrogenispora ethanolica]